MVVARTANSKEESSIHPSYLIIEGIGYETGPLHCTPGSLPYPNQLEILAYRPDRTLYTEHTCVVARHSVYGLGLAMLWGNSNPNDEEKPYWCFFHPYATRGLCVESYLGPPIDPTIDLTELIDIYGDVSYL